MPMVAKRYTLSLASLDPDIKINNDNINAELKKTKN
jgi:hypothetical protein